MSDEEKEMTLVPPIKVSDIVDIEITSVGKKNDGVGKVDNFIVFVADSQVGDKIQVKISKVFKNFAIAEKI